MEKEAALDLTVRRVSNQISEERSHFGGDRGGGLDRL